MIELHRILVPTDFSKYSQNALAYAVAFAEKFGAEIHLLHVVQDLSLFISLAKLGTQPKTRAQVPTYVLIPAFIMSELKTAFEIGFLIFMPFLIIDLIVSSTLMSMGMIMLPPSFISLPFKILLFVLVDGWDLVTHSLVASFH